jgi:esterase/lipase superfamily enzyme
LNALERLRLQNRLPQINNIIMAAPDVTPDQGSKLIPRLLATGKISGMTLYASNKDFAMDVSNHYNKAVPIGRLPPATLFPPLVTIDASAAAVTGFGHDYFISSPAVEQDIGYVIRNQAVPRNLSQANGYWRIVP